MGYLTDYVDYKGIRKNYQTGTPADYNEWMSDDNATGRYVENYHDERDAALERAKREYERRQALDRRISENASGVLTNRGFIDELNAAPENNDVSPVPTDYTLSSKAQNAKDAVEQYEGGLERTGSQFLDNAKAQIKDAITSPTRGPGSLAELFVNPLFDNPVNPDNPQLVLGDSPSSVTNTANVNNAVSTPIGTNIPGTFLNEYKLGIGDLLRPVNRESQVQNDKDQLKVASIGGY